MNRISVQMVDLLEGVEPKITRSGRVELVDFSNRFMPAGKPENEYDAFLQTIALRARGSLADVPPPRAFREDFRLVRHLASSDPMHSSPFEMVDLTFRISCPLFVAVHILRHRTGAFSMVSERYAKVDATQMYIPEPSFLRQQAAMNKQASGEELDERAAETCRAIYERHARAAAEAYEALLDTGLARERARLVLPQSMMTSLYMKASLLNMARLMRTRGALDKAFESPVQEETREVAAAMLALGSQVAPCTFALLAKYVIGAKSQPYESMGLDELLAQMYWHNS